MRCDNMMDTLQKLDENWGLFIQSFRIESQSIVERVPKIDKLLFYQDTKASNCPIIWVNDDLSQCRDLTGSIGADIFNQNELSSNLHRNNDTLI